MAADTNPIALLAFSWGPTEMIIVGAIAVLLFGNRLPSVARSMGRSLTEFKKGMQGVQDEFRDAMSTEPADAIDYQDSPGQDEAWDDRREPTAPAFEPPAPEASTHEQP